eukprot:3497112-Pyramimonas_sp.AAC.1
MLVRNDDEMRVARVVPMSGFPTANGSPRRRRPFRSSTPTVCAGLGFGSGLDLVEIGGPISTACEESGTKEQMGKVRLRESVFMGVKWAGGITSRVTGSKRWGCIASHSASRRPPQ